MNDFKFIELPKEEVLSEVELSMIEGASNCLEFSLCTVGVSCERYCGRYDTDPCSMPGGCAPSLYCMSYYL